MTVTKASLIEKVHATNPNMTRIQARETVESILNVIKGSLENGDGVLLSGFGKFEVKSKSARQGRNPQTGESLTLAPRKVVTFKVSGKVRRKINTNE